MVQRGSRAGDYRPQPWRDVAAAYLVHRGLRLASRAGRLDISRVLGAEWCHLARTDLAERAGCLTEDPLTPTR